MAFNPIDFFPELKQKQEKLDQRKKFAEALQAQVLQDENPNQMVGGIVVPYSPFQGAAKLGKALIGKNNQEENDAQGASLNQDLMAKLFGSSFGQQTQLAAGQGAPQGTTPAQSMAPPEGMMQGGGMAQSPAQDSGQFSMLEDKHGLPRGLLAAVQKQESGGNPNAVSPKGALGAFQFMPETAKQYGIDPLDPQQAADGAARYLGDLNKKYSGDLSKALAAYNWGPGNVDRKGLEMAPPETQNYIKKIGGQFAATMPNQQSQPQQLAQALSPGQQQPQQDNGLLGSMFAQNGVDPRQGALRFMMGDESVLKPNQLTPDQRYKVVGGQLVDVSAPGGPQAVFKPQGNSYTDPVTGEVTENRKLSAAEQKELFDTTDLISAGQGAKSALERAQSLMNSGNAPLTGAGAETLAAMERIPVIDKLNFISKERGAATTEFGNLIKEQALNSLKATFGSNPTEGERQILLGLQALPEYTPEEQKSIIKNAVQSAEKRIKFNESKVKSIETGNYGGFIKDLSKGGAQQPQAPQNVGNTKSLNGKNYVQIDGQWFEQ